MKDINLRQDAPSQVSQVNPDRISEEISKLQAVQQEIINKENEITEACKLAAAHEFIISLPEKYKTIIGAFSYSHTVFVFCIYL